MNKKIGMDYHAKSPARIIFGLGSNLGDRKKNILQSIDFLELSLDLKSLKKSEFLANKALLKENAPKEWDLEFLNLALSADIDLQAFTPEKILEIIKKIETDIGRVLQPVGTWAPREIDIDILAIDDLIIDLDHKLHIPHPALLERDFFIKTFAEIEPDWRYPRQGKWFHKRIGDF